MPKPAFACLSVSIYAIAITSFMATKNFLPACHPLLKSGRGQRSLSRAPQIRKITFGLVGQLTDELRNDRDGRIQLFLTPAGPQWCTEDLLRTIHRIADDRGLGHSNSRLETKYQRAYFHRTYGKSAVEWLDQLQFLSPNVSLAHGVWLSEQDIGLVAQRRSALVHNPSSNLRLKSGIAP